MDYTIAIVGGGPGGYVAALRATQLGARVCLIENDAMGGTCLNWGCIPTKTLLASTEVLQKIKHAQEYGIEVSEVQINMAKLMARREKVVTRLRSGVEHLLNKNKVTCIYGTGTVTSATSITITDRAGVSQCITAENIILATGSRPAVPALFNFDGERIITSNEALHLQKIPQEIIIIGGSVVGCEFATIFNALGAKVTIIEMLPTLLSTEDDEVIKRFTLTLKKKKIKVRTGTKIVSLTRENAKVVAMLDTGTHVSADIALVAIGRTMNTDNLGLENVGITPQKGMIAVDAYLQTSVKGIYAVGDITGKMALAHLASKQGMVAAENICGRSKKMDYRVVPRCVFTAPEVASVGVTERKAREQGIEVTIGKFSFAASGKAIADGETDGFVKLIADADDTLLGAHILGAHASNLLMELTLAIKLKAKAADIADTIHLHPTLSESVLEAAEDIAGLSIHTL